jgi:hypothetical protein
MTCRLQSLRSAFLKRQILGESRQWRIKELRLGGQIERRRRENRGAVPAGTGTGRVGSDKLFHGSGRVESSRVRADPLFTRRFVAVLEAADHNIRTKGRF